MLNVPKPPSKRFFEGNSKKLFIFIYIELATLDNPDHLIWISTLGTFEGYRKSL